MIRTRGRYAAKTTFSRAAHKDAPDTPSRTCVWGGPPRSRGVGLLLPQLLQEYLGRRPIGFRGIAGLAAGDYMGFQEQPAENVR